MADVSVDPGTLSVSTSMYAEQQMNIVVDPGALFVETSLVGTPIILVRVDPGALSVETSMYAEQQVSVSVDPGALSVVMSMLGGQSFIGKSEVSLSVYANNQLKMTKVISTEPLLSGDVVKRDKIFVNVQGTHLTLKLSNESLGRNMYLLDLHTVIAIISGR